MYCLQFLGRKKQSALDFLSKIPIYLSSERRNSRSLRTVSMPSKASMLSRSWVGGFRGVRKVWRKWGERTRETSRKAAEFRTWQLLLMMIMMTTTRKK